MAPFAQYPAVFRHRDFRLLVASFVVSSTGTWSCGVVLDVYVFTETHSLSWVAAMVVANLVPGFLVAPLAGLVADRYDRRVLVIASAALAGLAAAVLAVAVAAHAAVFVLLVLTALGAVVRSPYRPASGALTPEVVEKPVLATANGILGALENVVVVLGPAIGGLLLLLRSPAIAPALNAACWFLAALVAVGLVVRSRGEAGRGERAVTAIAEGVRALIATPTAGVLLVFATLDALLANAYPVLYLPISRHLGMGTEGYGWLLTGAAAGGIVGAVLGARLGTSSHLAPIIVGGIALQALPYAATVLTHAPAVGIGLQVLSGAGEIFVDVIALIAMQREVPAGRLSRVLSLLDMTVLLASAVGSVGISALLGALPYATALVVLGLGSIAVAVAVSPLLVRADRAAAARSTLEDRAVASPC